MAAIILKRTGGAVTHNGKKGEISELDVEGNRFCAVARREGFNTLEPGTYGVRMELSPTHKGYRQFRVTGHNKRNRNGDIAPILIHTGNYPEDAQGCIAPGLLLIPGGVDQSRPALEKIFTLFGGFKVGQTGTVVVTAP